MKKLLIGIAALALAVFAASAVAASDRRGGDTSLAGTTGDDGPGHRHHGRRHGSDDDDDRREAGEDVRGNCDEPEHARDARCAGSRSTTTRSVTNRTTTTYFRRRSNGSRDRAELLDLVRAEAAGRTTFLVSNASGDDHDFWLTGAGKTFRTQRLDGGASQRIVATLRKGVRYRYFCAVGSHAQAGMSGSFVAR